MQLIICVINGHSKMKKSWNRSTFRVKQKHDYKHIRMRARSVGHQF